jgi:outer membrane protein assembly factor BamB
MGDRTESLAHCRVDERAQSLLSPGSGPPGSSVRVAGSGFRASRVIAVFFDTTREALAVTNGAGAFSIAISVPSLAKPGTHRVTAVVRLGNIGAQAPFTVQTDWNQFRDDPSHHGFNSTENGLTRSNVSSLGQKWSYATGSSVSSSPAVANGVVYVGSANGKVYALNSRSGARLWSYTTDGPVYSSSPAVANGVVYIGNFGPQSPPGGKLYALNATSGALLWSYTTRDSVYSSPAVANGLVYIGGEDHKLYALNATSGALRWSYTTGSFVDSSPAVANGVVYIGSWDGKVYALNATSGKLLWSYTTGATIPSSPAVANGVVYIASQNGNEYALNATTGALLWSYTTGNSVDSSSPAVANGVVYIGSDDDNLYAFSLPGATKAVGRPALSSLEHQKP